MNGIWWCLGAVVIIALLVGWLLHLGRRAQVADWGNGFLNRLDGLNRLFCRYFHRFRFDTVAVPEQGGAIVASNHVSGLDPLLMISATNRPLRFMIATEQYTRPLLTWIYKGMGTIPVDRTGAPEKAFYQARTALEQGELIGMFPEGRIVDPGESVPLKRGVVLLADLAGAPIIPVRLSGVSGVGRVITAVFMRSKARLRVGPVIKVDGPHDEKALAELAAFFSNSPPRDAGVNVRE